MGNGGQKNVVGGPCATCAETRDLDEHLMEVALAAKLLGNKSIYRSEHGTITIATDSIGDWFRIAAQLQTVEVDTWKFEPPEADMYCGNVGTYIDAHGKHYTSHATALTRFVFVCNGVEEAYRYLDNLYAALADRKGVAKGKLRRSSSLKAVELLEDLFERAGAAALPRDFDHHCGIFIRLFETYASGNQAPLGGFDAGADARPTYALHLVRNLRNYVAHGTFPLGEPQEYGSDEGAKVLIPLLTNACRVAALYVQTILRWFCHGFHSDEYASIYVGNEEGQYDRFLDQCTLEYVRDLHVKGDFALHHNKYDYSHLDDEDD